MNCTRVTTEEPSDDHTDQEVKLTSNRTPMCSAQHHSITDYRHNQKKENTASSPFTFSSSTSQWSLVVVKFWELSQEEDLKQDFQCFEEWSKISFESFNSCVQFILEPLNIVSRSLHLFLSLFLLFLGEKYREIENWQHERKCEGEEKKTNILLSVKCPSCPSTMGTFHGAG